MKKVIAIVMTVTILFGVSACSKNVQPEIQAHHEVGTWTYVDVEFLEEVEDENSLKQNYKQLMGNLYLEFKDDNTGVLGYYNEGTNMEESFHWAKGKIQSENIEILYMIKDNTMTLDTAQNFTIIMEKLDD